MHFVSLLQSLCIIIIRVIAIDFLISCLAATISDEEMQEHYDLFFEEVFVELEDNYGEIEEMNVCDNLGDHLVGNVYIKVSADKNIRVFMKFYVKNNYYLATNFRKIVFCEQVCVTCNSLLLPLYSALCLWYKLNVRHSY